MDTSFYTASISNFVNEPTQYIDTQHYFIQRMLTDGTAQFMAITASIDSITWIPTYTIDASDDYVISDYDGTGQNASINVWRFENNTSFRNIYMIDYIYLGTGSGSGSPTRLIHPYRFPTSTFMTETWRKAEFGICNALVIPDGSYIPWAVVPAYWPWANMPISTSATLQFLAADWASCDTLPSDIIAYRQLSTSEVIVTLSPYQPRNEDVLNASASNFWVATYNVYAAAQINPNQSVVGHCNWVIDIVNRNQSNPVQIYVQNEDNLGYDTDTNTWPMRSINANTGVTLAATTDIVDPWYTVVDDRRDYTYNLDCTDVTYYNGTDTLYVPFDGYRYATIHTQYGWTLAVDTISLWTHLGNYNTTRLKLAPTSWDMDVTITTVASILQEKIYGVAGTWTLKADSGAVDSSDYMEIDRTNNFWKEYNTEILS